MAYFWSKFQQTRIEIPSYEEVDGVVFYNVQVLVEEVRWTVKHRYNDFSDLHDKLVNDHGVAKDILPSKKLLKSPEFIENRRRGLETYLMKVLKYLLLTMPRVFVEFLHLHVYDVSFLLQTLARNFSENYSLGEKSHQFSTLEMHAISMCCGALIPPNNYIFDRKYDSTHVLDLCLQLKSLLVRGSKCNYLNSNINPNTLWYDFKNFKNINSLSMTEVNLDSIKELGCLRSKLSSLTLIKSDMIQLCQILQCDILHKHKLDDSQIWTSLKSMDLSDNSLVEIDESIALAPNLDVLILNNNRFSTIPNLSVLQHLTFLSLSDNSINCMNLDQPIRLRLPESLRDLNLSSNSIESLRTFTGLVSLKSLDLSSNQIKDMKQIAYLTDSNILENLNLTGNLISTMVDYRVKVLEHFGTTSTVCLDNEQTTKDEIDKISIRKAIQKLKEGVEFNKI